jgi:hypothetical protein
MLEPSLHAPLTGKVLILRSADLLLSKGQPNIFEERDAMPTSCFFTMDSLLLAVELEEGRVLYDLGAMVGSRTSEVLSESTQVLVSAVYA